MDREDGEPDSPTLELGALHPRVPKLHAVASSPPYRPERDVRSINDVRPTDTSEGQRIFRHPTSHVIERESLRARYRALAIRNGPTRNPRIHSRPNRPDAGTSTELQGWTYTSTPIVGLS